MTAANTLFVILMLAHALEDEAKKVEREGKRSAIPKVT
jgi:hypothetical protein